MGGIIAELDSIANEVDDFRCLFEEIDEESDANITDETERAEWCVTKLDLIIDQLKESEGKHNAN